MVGLPGAESQFPITPRLSGLRSGSLAEQERARLIDADAAEAGVLGSKSPDKSCYHHVGVSFREDGLSGVRGSSKSAAQPKALVRVS